MPRYWVQEFDTRNEEKSKPDKPVYDLGVSSRLAAKHWNHAWLLGWRDICRSTDERTVISTAIPRAAVGDTYLLALAKRSAWLLQANLSAFVLDSCGRQKITGTHLKYFVFTQLPLLPPTRYAADCPFGPRVPLAEWVTERVLELSYTSYDMEGFARDLGDEGAPFRWDEERRALLRAELDAAYFHLYGVGRDDADYIMETFPIVRHHDEERFGEYRTKRLILEIYDAMADAILTGAAHRTVLDPPPGQGPRHVPRPVDSRSPA